MSDIKYRVKLYIMDADDKWCDRGIGHVSWGYVERLEGMSLVVKSESKGEVLLESKILPSILYQKQQDTLIVWGENRSDVALSFQLKAGCDEIWKKICEIVGKDPSVNIMENINDEGEKEEFSQVNLPSCELRQLKEINEVIEGCLASYKKKGELIVALGNGEYIKKLLNLFHICEDLNNMEGLHGLFNIFKNLFLLNSFTLFEMMFSEENIFDVVGCLEYDPSFAGSKKHRKYLKEVAKLKVVIPITNAELLAKIHQTYRLEYIQDIILSMTGFEDNPLSDYISCNKVTIVELIQEDESYLNNIFTQLSDYSTECSKRRDLILFLKEVYIFSLYTTKCEEFCKTWCLLGVLRAFSVTITSEDLVTKMTSIEILDYIVNLMPDTIRAYMLQERHVMDRNQMLLDIIINEMVSDNDAQLSSAVWLSCTIKSLLCREVNSKLSQDMFFHYFFNHNIHQMVAPLLAITSEEKLDKNDYKSMQLLDLILNILSFCVSHHSKYIKQLILKKRLIECTLVLLKSTHQFLVLSALRFTRGIIALNDASVNCYIKKKNIFSHIFEVFSKNNGRHNLLDSAILEMFEYMQSEDIRSLCVHVVNRYGRVVNKMSHIKTFKNLKLKYRKQKNKANNGGGPSSVPESSCEEGNQKQMEKVDSTMVNLCEAEKSISTSSIDETFNCDINSKKDSVLQNEGILGNSNLFQDGESNSSEGRISNSDLVPDHNHNEDENEAL